MNCAEHGYRVRWRRTDSSQWEQSRYSAFSTATEEQMTKACARGAPADLVVTCGVDAVGMVLKGVRVDDWVFGVAAVSADGFESPVSSAVPGGAFKPYRMVPTP